MVNTPKNFSAAIILYHVNTFLVNFVPKGLSYVWDMTIMAIECMQWYIDGGEIWAHSFRGRQNLNASYFWISPVNTWLLPNPLTGGYTYLKHGRSTTTDRNFLSNSMRTSGLRCGRTLMISLPGLFCYFDQHVPKLELNFFVTKANYQPRSEGDNALGSVCPSVCPSVCVHSHGWTVWPAMSNKSHYQSKVFVCVCNQWAHADNRAN